MTRRYPSKADEQLPMRIIDSKTQYVKWNIISATINLYIFAQKKKQIQKKPISVP